MKIKERITEINDRGVQKFLIYKTDKDGNPVRYGVLTWDAVVKRGLEQLRQKVKLASGKASPTNHLKNIRLSSSLADCQTGSNEEDS